MCGVFIGFILLLLAYMLPVTMMEKRVNNSSTMLEKEFEDEVLLDRYPGTYIGTFTDCLMLNSAIYNGGTHTILDQTINIYRMEISETEWMPGVALINYVSNHSGEEISYARYWHGYLAILKPTLLFFDFEEIRLINFICLSLLTLAICVRLNKEKKAKYILPFIVAMFFMFPMAIAMSISQAICVYILLIGMLVYLLYYKILNASYSYLYFFLILGMITSYLDLLTYPILPLGGCLVLYVILENPKSLAGIIYVIKSSFIFVAGYILMWVGKWVLAWILGSRSIWADALSTVKKRSGGVSNLSLIDAKIEAIIRNANMIKSKPLILLFIAIVIFAIILLVKHGIVDKKERLYSTVLYIGIGLYPLLWFTFADNHSYEHYMFTFRELFILIFAILAWLVSLSKGREKK